MWARRYSRDSNLRALLAFRPSAVLKPTRGRLRSCEQDDVSLRARVVRHPASAKDHGQAQPETDQSADDRRSPSGLASPPSHERYESSKAHENTYGDEDEPEDDPSDAAADLCDSHAREASQTPEGRAARR